MRVEEIAIRQEIRQLLTEAGLNKNTIREMANEVLREEMAKQVKNALNQNNINNIIKSKISSYEMMNLLKEAMRQEVRSAIKISVEVKAEGIKTE